MSLRAERKRAKYLQQVAGGLQAAYDDPATEVQRLELGQARLVIFSDQHKGARDRADDFQASERAYNAALAYYFALGYRLFVLGDVEELWECRPAEALRSYRRSLELEAAFHREGRYERFWGNHDDLWRYHGPVRHHLTALYPGHPLRVREALKFEVTQDGRRLGEFFLVHGHQGTLLSDLLGPVSRLFVRYGWRNIQRLTGWRLDTPATDFRLRGDHDWAMYRWAESRPDTILIAGHTHRPVLESRTHFARVEEEIEALSRRASLSVDDRRKLAALRAELEFTRAGERQGGDTSVEMTRPCYFNTGCCSFSDGDVTGLEIDGGTIKLVRWPNDDGQPLPQVLGKPKDLVQLFAELRRGTAAGAQATGTA